MNLILKFLYLLVEFSGNPNAADSALWGWRAFCCQQTIISKTGKTGKTLYWNFTKIILPKLFYPRDVSPIQPILVGILSSGESPAV